MLRQYIQRALTRATYEHLEDGTYCGEIAACPGTIAFGQTLDECERELESALGDWLISAFRHDDVIPIIDGINLNVKAVPAGGQMVAVQA